MNPALVFNHADGALVLCGGHTEAGKSNDLWIGDGSGDEFVWTPVSVEGGPAPRSSHDAVYSAGAIYVFGGLTDAGASNELWRLKLDE